MKSRLLKELLKTQYIIADYDSYIGIGSHMCHNLISIDKTTFKLKYALDYNNTDTINKNSPMFDIWNKLEELISNNKMIDIINGNDKLDIKLPVFYMNTEGNIIESYTDEYGYPNTTHDGKLMYDNYFFKTKREAIIDSLERYKIRVNTFLDNISQYERDLKTNKEKLKTSRDIITNLEIELTTDCINSKNDLI
jgi:hypothetical protein